MPCYRCGTRQVDPGRGESPWKRGVRGDQQVLVCPGCQAVLGGAADLDHCPACGSTRLVRRLGEVECRECGFVPAPAESADPAVPVPGRAVPAGAAPGAAPAGAALAGAAPAGAAPGLAEEVAQALERVLRRGVAARA